MARELTEKDIQKHKGRVLKKLDKHLTSIIDKPHQNYAKVDKLCFWLKDWINYLDYESKFNSKKLLKYKRGQVISANLGYNVGSELGGRHYCVVIDNSNSLRSNTVTVVPLTSLKEKKKRQHPDDIVLGNELYTALQDKLRTQAQPVQERLSELVEKRKTQNFIVAVVSLDERDNEINQIKKDLERLKHIVESFEKLNKGSVAHVGQIRTISKMRIETPKYKHEPLSGIKLSPDSMDLIDQAIIAHFTKKQKTY